MAVKKSTTISASSPEALTVPADGFHLTHLQYSDLEILVHSLEEITSASGDAATMQNTLNVLSLFGLNLLNQISNNPEGGAE